MPCDQETMNYFLDWAERQPDYVYLAARHVQLKQWAEVLAMIKDGSITSAQARALNDMALECEIITDWKHRTNKNLIKYVESGMACPS